MSKLQQLARNSRIAKKRRSKTPSMEGAPQIKGVVYEVTQVSPRKPNSAKRRIAKIKLIKIPKKVWARINGVGVPKIDRFSSVLVEGGNAKDLPGVNYRMVWGKYDFYMILHAKRFSRRSKFSLMTKSFQEKFNPDKFLKKK